MYPSRYTPHASITITDTTGPTPTVFGDTLGFLTSVTSNGVGDVTVTLDPGYAIDITNSARSCTPLGAAFLVPVVEPLTDTTYRIRCFDAAGVADEGGFDFTLFRKAVG